ncbi:MAG: methyltransferase domain-containing protein [Bacteroidales bacterium]|nr:methyltransferase domain-containing protein [Bacteroidales bacterium]
MEKFKYLQKIKELYANGENIFQYLRSIDNSSLNSLEDILISYDFQAGSYIKFLSQNSEFNNNYCKTLANLINDIADVRSIIEIGVGEATTLSAVLSHLRKKPSSIFGFDISWSRIKFAADLLNENRVQDFKLFTANLFEIPLPDNSIDVVYTSHSIEPNGGKEKEALIELYRITKNYLILLEPSYEFANNEARKRMEKNGYVRNLYSTAKELNFKVVEHRLFDFAVNPLNPTGLIIIEKGKSDYNEPELVCPITRTKLEQHNDSFLYSNESYLAYPILDNIPCLLKENSILAIHLNTEYEDFKRRNQI